MWRWTLSLARALAPWWPCHLQTWPPPTPPCWTAPGAGGLCAAGRSSCFWPPLCKLPHAPHSTRTLPALPCPVCSDVTHLSYLNEPGILNVLRQRYAGDAVYTAAGPVLLAVNPFRPLPLYGPDAARHYSQRGASSCCGSTSSSSGLTAAAAAAADYQPHVFLTADRAFKQVGAAAAATSTWVLPHSLLLGRCCWPLAALHAAMHACHSCGGVGGTAAQLPIPRYTAMWAPPPAPFELVLLMHRRWWLTGSPRAC